MFKRLETEMRVKAVNWIGMAKSSQAQIFEYQKSQYSLGSMEWRRVTSNANPICGYAPHSREGIG
jgi:hypothetical protein